MSPACSEPDLDRMGGEALLAVLGNLLESSPETSPPAPAKRVPAVKAGRAEEFRMEGHLLTVEMQCHYRQT